MTKKTTKNSKPQKAKSPATKQPVSDKIEKHDKEDIINTEAAANTEERTIIRTKANSPAKESKDSIDTTPHKQPVLEPVFVVSRS